jgi:hypothetical protein
MILAFVLKVSTRRKLDIVFPNREVVAAVVTSLS